MASSVHAVGKKYTTKSAGSEEGGVGLKVWSGMTNGVHLCMETGWTREYTTIPPSSMYGTRLQANCSLAPYLDNKTCN